MARRPWTPSWTCSATWRGLGVRVPAIHAFEEAEGLMVLEDLGDDMLETRLLAGDPPGRLYQRAVDQLARLRAAAERPARGLRGLRPRLRLRPLPLGAAPLPGVAARGLEGRAALPGRAGRGGPALRRGSPARWTPSRADSPTATTSRAT